MGLNANVLKGWLREVGALDKTLTRKPQFAQAIEQQLNVNLPRVVARLTNAEKQLLAESAHQNRLVSNRQFAAKYGGNCPMPSFYHSWRDKVSLLVPFIHQGDYRFSEPPDLITSLVEPLRALLPEPEGLKVRAIDTLPKAWPSEQEFVGGKRIRTLHVFESERIASAELSRVLRLIQVGKIKISDASQRPTEATMRLVREALVVPDFDLEMPDDHRSEFQRKYYKAAGSVRAHAWPVLVQQCGWAKKKRGTLSLTKAGNDILHQFTAERFREGVSRFVDNDEFDELNRINHIRGQSGKAKRWMSNPILRKAAIAEAVEPFPVGKWLEFEEARRVVEASPEDCDVLETRAQGLYFFEPQYGYIIDNIGLGRQFMRAFFMESLATLGVLDVAFVYPHHLWPDLHDSLNGDLPFCGRYDGLVYVRLNPLGAYALGVTEHYDLQLEAKPKLFRVLPNLELVLTDGSMNPADRAELELLAVPKSDMVWALDSARMLTHVETGGAFQELQTFLETNAVEGLPENVRTFLTELENKLTASPSRRDAVLLEWPDAALAQLIATSTGTTRLCFHAGENRLVVPKENLTAFTRAVKKLGYVLPHPNA